MFRQQEQKGTLWPSPWPPARRLLAQIHLKTDFDGQPTAFGLTGSEKGNAPHFPIRLGPILRGPILLGPILLGIGPDVDPGAAMGDKGYDGKTNPEAARSRWATPVIPYRSMAKSKPTFFPKALYRGHARIEQEAGKLKCVKRVALRCEKTKQNFASIVAITAGFISIEYVHNT